MFSKNISRIAIVATLIPFSILTALAVWHHGFLGIFQLEFQNYGTAQVFFDLVIAEILLLVWMWSDAKKTNRVFWPWALITLTAGSFGPLLYLLFGSNEQN